ncbi:MAG TPA: transposase [Bryobacteraceae bacterium]|nr:transposase [Bryobacteraceae bacterium]
MRHYERRLPHWDSVDQPLFVTFRLHGSLPRSRVFPPAALITAGKAFVAVDRLLDACTDGPSFLRRKEIAEMMVAALRHGDCELQRYELHSFVVMPNHVHLLVTPHVLAAKWLGPLKGFTGHQANRMLGTHGPFWQEESFDRLVRSDAQFDRIRDYIEQNPVKAGLAGSAEEFRWSSAYGDRAA